MKKPVVTKTIRRIALWNAGVMFGLYLAFSIFTLFILNYILIDDLDTRLRHELEHILNTIDIYNDTIRVIHPTELNEIDLLKVTENPFFLQIYSLDGKLFLQSENLKHYKDILLGFPNKFTPYYYDSFFVDDEQLRTIYKQLINQKKEHIGYIQLSAINSSFNQVVKNVFWFNIFTMPFVFATIIILSVFLAKKSYSPVNKIIELADKISATNLSERLEYDAEPNDELGKLKTTLNSLFDRLESQIDQISQFTDNASHQLMTPLTAIKTELEYILKKKRTSEEYIETANILKDQTDKMIVLIRTMLLLARDCKECADNSIVFDLTKLLTVDIKDLYNNKNVIIKVEGNIFTRGKAEYFSIVLQNLINNALKYSNQSDKVLVSADVLNSNVIIKVIDNGIGISDFDKDKIFERFYRVENEKTENIDGYGLGLSLAQSVVTSMGGKIEVVDNKPKGTIFIITLPIINLN